MILKNAYHAGSGTVINEAVNLSVFVKMIISCLSLDLS